MVHSPREFHWPANIRLSHAREPAPQNLPALKYPPALSDSPALKNSSALKLPPALLDRPSSTGLTGFSISANCSTSAGPDKSIGHPAEPSVSGGSLASLYPPACQNPPHPPAPPKPLAPLKKPDL
jgi:hypothetical protein